MAHSLQCRGSSSSASRVSFSALFPGTSEQPRARSGTPGGSVGLGSVTSSFGFPSTLAETLVDEASPALVTAADDDDDVLTVDLLLATNVLLVVGFVPVVDSVLMFVDTGVSDLELGVCDLPSDAPPDFPSI